MTLSLVWASSPPLDTECVPLAAPVLHSEFVDDVCACLQAVCHVCGTFLGVLESRSQRKGRTQPCRSCGAERACWTAECPFLRRNAEIVSDMQYVHDLLAIHPKETWAAFVPWGSRTATPDQMIVFELCTPSSVWPLLHAQLERIRCLNETMLEHPSHETLLWPLLQMVCATIWTPARYLCRTNNWLADIQVSAQLKRRVNRVLAAANQQPPPLSITKKFEPLLPSILDVLSRGKHGWLPRTIERNRVDNCGRAVLGIDPFLRPDEISLPRRMCETMLVQDDDLQAEDQCELWSLLDHRQKCVLDDTSVMYVTKYLPPNKPIPSLITTGRRMLRPQAQDKILINRQPSLRASAIQCRRLAGYSSGPTIKLPPVALSSFGGDCDGDDVAVLVLKNKHAQIEANERLHPARQLRDEATGQFLYMPHQTAALGLYLMHSWSKQDLTEMMLRVRQTQGPHAVLDWLHEQCLQGAEAATASGFSIRLSDLRVDPKPRLQLCVTERFRGTLFGLNQMIGIPGLQHLPNHRQQHTKPPFVKHNLVHGLDLLELRQMANVARAVSLTSAQEHAKPGMLRKKAVVAWRPFVIADNNHVVVDIENNIVIQTAFACDGTDPQARYFCSPAQVEHALQVAPPRFRQHVQEFGLQTTSVTLPLRPLFCIVQDKTNPTLTQQQVEERLGVFHLNRRGATTFWLECFVYADLLSTPGGWSHACLDQTLLSIQMCYERSFVAPHHPAGLCLASMLMEHMVQAEQNAFKTAGEHSNLKQHMDRLTHLLQLSPPSTLQTHAEITIPFRNQTSPPNVGIWSLYKPLYLSDFVMSIRPWVYEKQQAQAQKSPWLFQQTVSVLLDDTLWQQPTNNHFTRASLEFHRMVSMYETVEVIFDGDKFAQHRLRPENVLSGLLKCLLPKTNLFRVVDCFAARAAAAAANNKHWHLICCVVPCLRAQNTHRSARNKRHATFLSRIRRYFGDDQVDLHVMEERLAVMCVEQLLKKMLIRGSPFLQDARILRKPKWSLVVKTLNHADIVDKLLQYMTRLPFLDVNKAVINTDSIFVIQKTSGLVGCRQFIRHFLQTRCLLSPNAVAACYLDAIAHMMVCNKDGTLRGVASRDLFLDRPFSRVLYTNTRSLWHQLAKEGLVDAPLVSSNGLEMSWIPWLKRPFGSDAESF